MSRLSHLVAPTHPSPQADPNSAAWGYLSSWCDELRLQNYSERTIKTYQTALIQFLNFVASDKYLNGDPLACRRQDLIRFFGTRLEEAQIKPISAKLSLSAIRIFYQFLIKQGALASNPATGYKIKSAPRKLPTVADEMLIQQLLDQKMPEDAAKARLWVRDKAMFELMYSSGLRLSELAGLNVGDVNFDTGIVRVLGKGNKTRQVPVGKKALIALQDYLPHRDLWQEQNSDALFISERHGTRLSTRAIQLRLKACAAMAGIELNMYPHMLRHCFASHVLSSSGDLRAIQEMLGHQNISTTQIYTHVDFGALTRVYDHAHPRAHRSK
ncbi:site-specific tyrosine recombinase/integron integrase [Moraxella canis]|uniref:Tyrosine recombinase XerC n=1 Tax=Moraxella canis TaxID=90239 RepID=A0A1S9ZHH1_9GAMM|nr:site-specific tyrosine recombinase/integron integrase [Moraxella canis]OOR82992.1 recombinase XerC [Moraxella canis]